MSVLKNSAVLLQDQFNNTELRVVSSTLFYRMRSNITQSLTVQYAWSHVELLVHDSLFNNQSLGECDLLYQTCIVDVEVQRTFVG